MQKPREQIVHGKQKNKFAGAAKKNKGNKVAQKSLVPVDNHLDDSDDDNQPEYGNMVIVAKPKHVSPQLINAIMVGITRRNPDHRRISECDVSVEQVQGNDEVDAEMSFHEYAQEDLFGDRNVQKTLQSRDVMDQQGSAQNDQQDEDPIPGLEPDTNESA